MKAPTLDPVYTDFQSLARLKDAARRQSPEASKEAAQQFEAIFLQMMLKSMREASLGDGGLLDSDQSRFYRDMFDKQLALNMANRGGLGLTKVLQQQWRLNSPPPRHAPETAPEDGLTLSARATRDPVQIVEHGASAPAPGKLDLTSAPQTPLQPLSSSPQHFVAQLWPHARGAARALGVTPHVLIAQAALETGWGRGIPQFGDGRTSHNLFGIKADRGWHGQAVVNNTLEYENNLPVRRRDGFRAYDSYGDSFMDYVSFLKTNPRYKQALKQTTDLGYIHALHRAGYATDPNYADKVGQILSGTTLKQATGLLKSAPDGPIVKPSA